MEELSGQLLSAQSTTGDQVTDGIINNISAHLDTTPNISQHVEDIHIPAGYSTPHIILTSILVSVIMVVIVFGNLLVVIAIFTDRNLKTTQNWFIASLAVADCALGLVIMPFSLANEMMGYWYFGHLWCDLWKAIDVLLSTASILSICLISLDRYWSITRAVTYSRQRTPTRAALMIAAVWFLSAVICVPPLIGWKNPLPVSEYPLCLLSDDIGYVIYSTMGSFYIPCVIMVFVYFKIFQAARKLARKNIRKKEKIKKFKEAHQDDMTTGLPDSCDKPSSNETSAINEGKDTPQVKAKNMNEHSKLVNNELEVESCKNNNTSPNVHIDDCRTTPVGNSSNCNLKQPDSLESLSMEENEANISAVNAVPNTGDKHQSQTLAPHDNTTDRTRSHIRKLSDTISKKRCKSNNNRGSKNWRACSLREHERQRRKMAKARERRATIVLGLVMAAFILCWFPFFTLYIITSFCNCIGEVVFAVVFWAGYCNSALNPIIYTIFNRDFRQAFYKIICKRLIKRR